MHETKVKRGGAMGDAKRNERAGIRVGGRGMLDELIKADEEDLIVWLRRR